MTTLAQLRRSRHLADGLTSADFARLRDEVGRLLAAVDESSPEYWRGHIDAALRQPFNIEESEAYLSGRKLGNRLVLINGWNTYADDSIDKWKRQNRKWVQGVGSVYDKQIT